MRNSSKKTKSGSSSGRGGVKDFNVGDVYNSVSVSNHGEAVYDPVNADSGDEATKLNPTSRLRQSSALFSLFDTIVSTSSGGQSNRWKLTTRGDKRRSSAIKAVVGAENSLTDQLL